MGKRYISVWFCHLLADWQAIRHPELQDIPFVLVMADHGRMVVTAVSQQAQKQGVEAGMRAADAKAICPGLKVINEKPGRALKLLKALGEWCIRYTPTVAVDEFSSDGLIMEVSGCPHLWGGEREYLQDMKTHLKAKGYTVRLAIADTIGAAWAVSRFGKVTPLISPGTHTEALLYLPPEALRIEKPTVAKLQKLGFYQIKSFIGMPRSVLRRRFGESFLTRLGEALGTQNEAMCPITVPLDFQERLPCLEPVKTRKSIEMGINKLLECLCLSLEKEGKGLRTGVLTCYRVDGKIIKVDIGTNAPTHSVSHLFKLFELKIDQIRPALGIELFILAATKVEDLIAPQEVLWDGNPGLNDRSVIQLLDRVAGKVGAHVIHRYLPDTRYWPERSVKDAGSISEKASTPWRTDKPRPTELLRHPEPIEVMALIPDHPPKFFVYKAVRHQVVKADGPERIEREWWLDAGEHRDYYQVEDQYGQRYWLFRSGHYFNEQPQWYIHGFFA